MVHIFVMFRMDCVVHIFVMFRVGFVVHIFVMFRVSCSVFNPVAVNFLPLQSNPLELDEDEDEEEEGGYSMCPCILLWACWVSEGTCLR